MLDQPIELLGYHRKAAIRTVRAGADPVGAVGGPADSGRAGVTGTVALMNPGCGPSGPGNSD